MSVESVKAADVKFYVTIRTLCLATIALNDRSKDEVDQYIKPNTNQLGTKSNRLRWCAIVML